MGGMDSMREAKGLTPEERAEAVRKHQELQAEKLRLRGVQLETERVKELGKAGRKVGGSPAKSGEEAEKGPEASKSAYKAAKKNLPRADLDGLTREQVAVLGDLVLLRQLSLGEQARLMKWLMEDTRFQAAYERRRMARMRMRAFEMDERLMESAKDLEPGAIALYNKRIGTLPAAGSEYVKEPPRDTPKTDKELDDVVKELLKKKDQNAQKDKKKS